MTKKVRVENADNSTHKVWVQVWSKNQTVSDEMIHDQILLYPTELGEFYIHSGQYLIIKEKE